MGTGVGEAAMYGALFGGAKAAATGEDIITGALTGGATSGAMSGIMGSDLLGNAASKTGAYSEFNPLPDTSSQYWSPATDVATSSTVASNYNPAALSGMQNMGISSGYVPDPSYVGQTMSPMAATITPEQAIAAQNQIAGQGIAPAVAAKQGMFDKGMDWWNNQDMLTKGMVSAGAGYGLGALTAPPPTVEALEEEDNPMGLARYKRSQFTPSTPQANVYRPSYAEGGIAALAGGGYPQGRQDSTQYATPSQMPTSAEVVNADYEVATDPYMGTPLRMAEGGGAYGDSIPTPTRTVRESVPVIDPKVIEAQRVAAENAASQAAAAAARKSQGRQIGMSMSGPIYERPNAGPSMATVGMARQAPNTPTTPTSFIAKDFKPSTGATGKNTNIYRPQYAEGGITGYNLGGYASGGNPRLLKGPGDGMSDNIPATIGDRQPARLADGEFVVPADVVSHLGNGSTDAGAKHLYNMMDKVRKARTGNKKQGKQIKAEKFLPK